MNKSYQEYLDASKPITRDLAPLTARPKSTRGDFTGDRFKAETIKMRGGIDKDHIPRRKGLINISALKKIKKGTI